MPTSEIFTANRIVNYLLLNNKRPIIAIVLIFCTLIRLSWWFSSFWHWDNAACIPEVLAGVIATIIYTVLIIPAVVNYTQNGTKQLTTLLSIINNATDTLEATFKSNISLNFQRLVVKYSVLSLSVYISVVISAFYILDPNPVFGLLNKVLYILGSTITLTTSLWINFLILMELILLSILGAEIESMVGVVRKWDYRYANLCVGIGVQWILVTQIFGVVTLTFVTDNFKDILLTIWSSTVPNASCSMNGFQFMLVLCCIWIIAIIESGERVNRKVRNLLYTI